MMATFQGKHTTLQGTFVRVTSQVLAEPDNYCLSNGIIITTNEAPQQYQNEGNGFIGWLRDIEDVEAYYANTSKTYAVVKGLLIQTGRQNVRNMGDYFKFGIYYAPGVDATSAFIKTEDIAQRLGNFNPETFKKFVLSIQIDDVVEKKELSIYKAVFDGEDESKAVDKLVILLNNAGFSCKFENDNGEIKLLSPRLGAGHNISVVASTTIEGIEDMAGAQYLNLVSVEQTNGANDIGNDFISAIPDLITQGINPTLLTSTAVVTATTLKAWEDALINLSQSNNCRYIPLIYCVQSSKENLAFAELLTQYQACFVSAPVVGYCDDKARLQLQGAILSAVSSVDYGDVNRGGRVDPEWGFLKIDSDLLATYQGFNNKQVNELFNEGIGDIVFYSDYARQPMIMGNNHGWSLIERCAYSVIAEEVMMAVINNRIYASNKTKTSKGIADVISAVSDCCMTFKNNNYITNEPNEESGAFSLLDEEVQSALKAYGFAVVNANIQDGTLYFDLYVVLNGIISRVVITNYVLSN